MAEITYNIYEIEPNGLSGFKALPPEDIDLITSTEVSKTFKPNDNFIELSFFTLDNTRLETISTYDRYSILSGDKKDGLDGNSEIGIDVQGDYLAYGYGSTEGKVLYNFLDYPYSNTALPQDFYIESISTDRTELRLVSVNLDSSTVLDTTNEIKTQFDGAAYIPDFHLYFGNSIFFTIVNIDAKAFRETTAVLVKLLEPLPRTIGVKATLNIVEKVSDSIAYEINTVITPDKEVIPTLRGANFAIDLDAQATEPSQYFNYNELFSFASYNSYREINSLFNEKGAELGIDYSDFANFINFSSAEERLRNFRYKLQLLESYQTQLDVIQGTDPAEVNSTPPLGYTGTGVTGTTQYWKSLIEGIINNFDHYERHLFYENDDSAWPKLVSSTTSTNKPYQNLLTTNAAATAWYNAELQDAILFDAQNGDLLRNTVPSYLIEDPDNRPYELIVHMVAQHFDNIWIYTNQVSEKYDADNRLDRGASKDLIEELLKNFGIKLYTSNKSVEDLFRYFTNNSYDSGNESITPVISQGESVSQNDYQKEIYKRIYHNLPLLMKSKGTERGLRALINCFGIPSDILKVRVFGGESSEEFPFFGGQQAITGSIDKVRLSNTGSIAPGNTTSFYTSIIKQNNEYTPDLHRIEVGFSPAYNINEYIVSQSAVLFPNDPFDIDDYIGDPRGYETNKYPPLYAYAETILANIDAYNLKDFVRLIKFFDNVLFRMIRDFTPARAVTDAGVIIKPHLLDRSKFKSPEMTWTRPEYSGSIDTAFITGSHGNAFHNVGYGSIGRQSSTKYLRGVMTPFGRRDKRINNFNAATPDEEQIEKNFDEAKFDGEFKNSKIIVSNGELNEDNPYTSIEYPNITYNVDFIAEIPADYCILHVPSEDFFVVEPDQIVNLANEGLFIGVNTINYNFLVDNNQPNQLDDVNHQFSGEQYETFVVNAQHEDNPDIDNNYTLEDGCEADRNVVIVDCKLLEQALGSGLTPSFAQPNLSYNLLDWFFQLGGIGQQEVINYLLDFYINNVYIGSVEVDQNDNHIGTGPTSSGGFAQLGMTPLDYTFPDLGGDATIQIKIVDQFDRFCEQIFIIDFSSCALADVNDSTDNTGTPIKGGTVTTPLTVGGGAISFPYEFTGWDNSTAFYFRLKIIIFDQNVGANPYFIPAGAQPIDNGVYGPGNLFQYQGDLNNDDNWIEIPDPDDFTFGSLSYLPNNYQQIVDKYEEELELDVRPTNNLGEYPPNPDSTNNTGATYYIDKFVYYIQFKAVNNENCEAIGNIYVLNAPQTVRMPIELYFQPNMDSLGNYSSGLTACSALQLNEQYYDSDTNPDGNKIIVYVDVPDTTQTVDISLIFDDQRDIWISDDPNDTLKPQHQAPRGAYFSPNAGINNYTQVTDPQGNPVNDYNFTTGQLPANYRVYVGRKYMLWGPTNYIFGGPRFWKQFNDSETDQYGAPFYEHPSFFYRDDIIRCDIDPNGTSTGGTGFGGGGGGGGQGYIGLTSDIRLKENIKRIATSPSGIPIYSFEYKDKKKFGDGTYQGVLSHEVPAKAVSLNEEGYEQVDYSKIDVLYRRIK
jgi:hypothetical protein